MPNVVTSVMSQVVGALAALSSFFASMSAGSGKRLRENAELLALFFCVFGILSPITIFYADYLSWKQFDYEMAFAAPSARFILEHPNFELVQNYILSIGTATSTVYFVNSRKTSSFPLILLAFFLACILFVFFSEFVFSDGACVDQSSSFYCHATNQGYLVPISDWSNSSSEVSDRAIWDDYFERTQAVFLACIGTAWAAWKGKT